MIRLWKLVNICLIAVLATGCGPLYQGIMRFDVVEYNGAGVTDVSTLAKSESGAMVAQTMKGLADTDALQRRLWERLVQLPDIADGIDRAEAEAIVILARLVQEASPGTRVPLRTLIDGPVHPYGYNGALQGLLWMIEDGGSDLPKAGDLSAEECLEYAYQALPRRYPTPESVLDYMSWHFSYVLNYYRFKSKREFFRDKAGDCTEFTLLAGDILRRQGRRVSVMLTRPSPVGGHVSLVYNSGGGYWLMDASSAALAHMIGQADRRRNLSPTEKEVLKEIKPYYRLFGPAPTREELVEIYERNYGHPVPFKFISFEELDKAAETHGLEMTEWWDFNDSTPKKEIASERRGRKPS